MDATSYIEQAGTQRSLARGLCGILALLMMVIAPPGAISDLSRYVDRQGTVYALCAPDNSLYQEIKVAKRPDPPAELTNQELNQTIRVAAKLHRLSPALIWAVIKAESDFKSGAVSSKGALGLMQLMPSTAAYLNVENPLNPIENIRGGAKYLRYLLNRFDGDVSLALAAYNAGEQKVRQYGDQIPPFRQTQRYVEKVLSFYDAFQADMKRRT
jgi:soluble lytic murein transglycosylase